MRVLSNNIAHKAFSSKKGISPPEATWRAHFTMYDQSSGKWLVGPCRTRNRATSFFIVGLITRPKYGGVLRPRCETKDASHFATHPQNFYARCARCPWPGILMELKHQNL
jgi:hypothetical protein